MKKMFFLLATIGLFIACDNKKKEACCSAKPKTDSATTKAAPGAVQPTANVYKLTCNNGYGLIADYTDAETADVVYVTPIKNGTEGDAVKLYGDASAASGAKYTSKDGTVSFWEAGDSYTYYVGGNAVCECTD